MRSLCADRDGTSRLACSFDVRSLTSTHQEPISVSVLRIRPRFPDALSSERAGEPSAPPPEIEIARAGRARSTRVNSLSNGRRGAWSRFTPAGASAPNHHRRNGNPLEPTGGLERRPADDEEAALPAELRRGSPDRAAGELGRPLRGRWFDARACFAPQCRSRRFVARLSLAQNRACKYLKLLALLALVPGSNPGGPTIFRRAT
jgi:hypothetical protein